MSFCILIPMYNEEKGAAACIDAVMSTLSKLKDDVTFFVVNDGSKDKTDAILNEKQIIYGKKMMVVSYKKNRGYGGALQAGIREAHKQGITFTLFMDSDLTNSPKDIPRFLKLASQDVDCVKATRYSLGGKMVGVPLYRRVVSILGNTFASACFRVGLRDCTNGFRMVRTSLLSKINFKEKKFSIILEELYELKKKHARFMSVPVVLTSRENTASHFTYSLRTFFDYGKYAIKAALL